VGYAHPTIPFAFICVHLRTIIFQTHYYFSITITPSISTAALRGKDATPIAARAG
jgi:hypothetical protein